MLYKFENIKGRLRATIFKSAERVHLILLRYLGDAIRCAVSADLKMAARNRSLENIFDKRQKQTIFFSRFEDNLKLYLKFRVHF